MTPSGPGDASLFSSGTRRATSSAVTSLAGPGLACAFVINAVTRVRMSSCSAESVSSSAWIAPKWFLKDSAVRVDRDRPAPRRANSTRLQKALNFPSRFNIESRRAPLSCLERAAFTRTRLYSRRAARKHSCSAVCRGRPASVHSLSQNRARSRAADTSGVHQDLGGLQRREQPDSAAASWMASVRYLSICSELEPGGGLNARRSAKRLRKASFLSLLLQSRTVRVSE